MIDSSSPVEIQTVIPQVQNDDHKENPFGAISHNNQSGPDITPPHEYSSAELEQQALANQMRAMIEMKEAREEIAEAQGQGGANMNPADQANQEIPEMPPVETISASVTKMETPKKSLWKWSSLDIENFLKDLAIKMKLDKVVEVVKNVVQAPFKAFGRLWTSGDVSRTPINPPPGLPQAT